MRDFIEIKLDDSKIKRALHELERRTEDRTPVMREISQIMLDAVEENFDTQGQGEWFELRASTILSRKKKGYWPGKILQQRGELARSITANYDNDTAEVGTNLVYAAIHHFGGEAGRKNKRVNITARPYLYLTEKKEKDVISALREYVEG